LTVPRDRDVTTNVFRLAAIALIAYVAATMFGPILNISLLIFSGLLLAVALDAAITWVQQVSRAPRWLALVAVVLLSVVGVLAFIVIVAPRLATEIEKLWVLLPNALDALGDRLGQRDWGARFMAQVPTIEEVLGSKSVLRDAFGALSGVVGVVGAGFLVIFIGLFVASDPHVYLRGILYFFPAERRERARETLTTMATGLRRWLIAKLVGMAIIGIATWVGLTVLGIPLAFALGVLAAALTFIPNIGPFVSAIPAVLLAFLRGPTTALVVIALFIAIQFVESYIVSPVIQRRMLSLPPALTLGAQALLGAVAGSLGLVVATPILAAIAAAMIARDDELAEIAGSPASRSTPEHAADATETGRGPAAPHPA
jgi:predicted PurR-regulated permease PerM